MTASRRIYWTGSIKPARSPSNEIPKNGGAKRFKKNRELWKDLQDVRVSQSRWHEKRIPLAKIKAGLIKIGKLSRANCEIQTQTDS
jgi:hypothetical protein